MENLAKAFSNAIKPEESKGGVPLFVILFKAKEDAHITHVKQPTKSMADHLALGSFYETLDGILDTLIETYFGLYGPSDIVFTASGIGSSIEGYFTKLLATVREQRTPLDKDTFIGNQIDEVEQLISHTLYKLKYVKC
jgi:hypothetical protein